MITLVCAAVICAIVGVILIGYWPQDSQYLERIDVGKQPLFPELGFMYWFQDRNGDWQQDGFYPTSTEARQAGIARYYQTRKKIGAN